MSRGKFGPDARPPKPLLPLKARVGLVDFFARYRERDVPPSASA